MPCVCARVCVTERAPLYLASLWELSPESVSTKKKNAAAKTKPSETRHREAQSMPEIKKELLVRDFARVKVVSGPLEQRLTHAHVSCKGTNNSRVFAVALTLVFLSSRVLRLSAGHLSCHTYTNESSGGPISNSATRENRLKMQQKKREKRRTENKQHLFPRPTLHIYPQTDV